nr:MAG TPA: hypothetical protein [Caudoviricetes sp.]
MYRELYFFYLPQPYNEHIRSYILRNYIQSKLIQYSLRAFIVLRGIVLSNI